MPGEGVMMSSFQKKIRFKYVFDERYDPVYISGAMGGITPKQDIVVNFFFERHPVPYSETYTLDKKGMLAEKVSSEPLHDDETYQFIRTIKSGVVLNLQTARELKIFLEHHIRLLEEIEAGSEKKKEDRDV
jgi:hypothetical protein